MTSEVVVDVQPKEISIALLEDKRLVEFQQEGLFGRQHLFGQGQENHDRAECLFCECRI